MASQNLLKCDSDWEMGVFDSYETYMRGKLALSTAGKDLFLGKDVAIEIPGRLQRGLPIQASLDAPRLASRSSYGNRDQSRLKAFFEEERGKIALAQGIFLHSYETHKVFELNINLALCYTNRVEISSEGRKRFTKGFLNAILEFERTNNLTRSFEAFVSDYGTHFSLVSMLGVKLYQETRFTEADTNGRNEKDLMECNLINGAKLLGRQLERDETSCPELKGNLTTDGNESLDRHVVRLYGTYFAANLTEWGGNILTEAEKGLLKPAVVRRRLKPIVSLVKDKNFIDLKVNATAIRKKLVYLMKLYCGTRFKCI